jgi:hypothetical protein
MRSVNWLNTAGYFFGVWVISMGGQWSKDFSGFSLILIPVDQTNASSWVYGIQALVTIYTIAMLGATGYSLYRHFSSDKKA